MGHWWAGSAVIKKTRGEHLTAAEVKCEDQVLDGPASGEKGSKGRN